MTSKAALCKVLLDGQVVNIRNIHQLTGFTNAGREIGRAIERKEDGGFGVLVSRTPMEGKNRFGTNRVQPRRSIVIQRGNSYSHFAPHANNGAAGIDATHNGGRVVYVALPELRA